MIRTERKPPADNWYHGGQSTRESDDPLGIHDCIKPKEKPPSRRVIMDFLRDPEGVPIVGPDGQPWFVERDEPVSPDVPQKKG